MKDLKVKKKGLLALIITIAIWGCKQEASNEEDKEETLEYVATIDAEQTTVIEGEQTTVNIVLDNANESGSNISISYELSGTATKGSDYDNLSGSASIADGETFTSFSVETVDDNTVEDDETVILTLSNPTTGDVSLATDKSVTITIQDNDDETTVGTANDISVLATKFYHTDAVTVTYDDSWVTVTTKDLPDHESMYYDKSNDLYEAYDEPDNDDFYQNPGSIGEQNIVFKLPRYPVESTNKESPGLGPMGVAINSVVFFNQEAAPGDDIFEELNTFDQYEGHPAGETYHYHIEPIWLTDFKGNEAFVGFLLDGFPVYSTHEDGVEITNDDLDDYHGHFGVTADFPDGIYHYHITVEYPWINGDGYYGTPGTRTL